MLGDVAAVTAVLDRLLHNVRRNFATGATLKHNGLGIGFNRHGHRSHILAALQRIAGTSCTDVGQRVDVACPPDVSGLRNIDDMFLLQVHQDGIECLRADLCNVGEAVAE